MAQYEKINKYNPLYKQTKRKKTQDSLSLDAEKTLNKIQHIFMIKVLERLEIKEIYLNIIEAVYCKPIVNIKFNEESIK